MAMSVTACKEDSGSGDTSGNTTKSSSTSDKEKSDKSSSKDITIEAVLEQPVSPEGEFTFSQDPEGNKGIGSYTGSDSIVVTPDTYDGGPVTKIDQYAFANRNSEKAIRFSDSVVELSNTCCALNEGLEVVVLGANTKTIGEGAFLQCTALREIKLNDGLEKIATISFSMCENLESITIPESVTTIESGAFTGLEKTLVIHGKAGSAAEEFAKTEGIQFVAE